jgi:hypothetical protein
MKSASPAIRTTLFASLAWLLAACNQQWPPPPPVPGQPLTYPQKHYLYLQQQQQMRDFRFR